MWIGVKIGKEKKKKGRGKKNWKRRQKRSAERGGSQRTRSESCCRRDSGFSLLDTDETVAGLPLRPTHIPSFRPIGPRWSRIPANNGQLIRYRDRLHTNAVSTVLNIWCVDGGWRVFVGKSASCCSLGPLFFAHRGRRVFTGGEEGEGKAT